MERVGPGSVPTAAPIARAAHSPRDAAVHAVPLRAPQVECCQADGFIGRATKLTHAPEPPQRHFGGPVMLVVRLLRGATYQPGYVLFLRVSRLYPYIARCRMTADSHLDSGDLESAMVQLRRAGVRSCSVGLTERTRVILLHQHPARTHSRPPFPATTLNAWCAASRAAREQVDLAGPKNTPAKIHTHAVCALRGRKERRDEK